MEDLPMKKVVWLDSNTRSGWHYPEDQKYGPLKVVTVGHVIKETDEAITLSASVVFGENYQTCDTMTIPICCILSIKDVSKR